MYQSDTTTVHSVLLALDQIYQRRMVKDWKEITEGKNPFVVMKASHIPGKSPSKCPG
ncbi:hypothetical protein [Ammoniphilus sp. 3BR4]|uniref:hypothetical protein n=1 Tax=Ammoniphilus sp. 3BR4 TaxID=3158265 RepID=UPI0034668F54